MELGEGLELDPDDNIIAPDGTGDTISDQATINSSYFSAGIGKGLGVVGGNEFSRMDLPPYNCRTTDLYTAGVSNFGDAWQNCTSLTSFPLLDVSSGTNFFCAWQNCTSLTTFPAAMFNTCTATNFTNAWQNCALNQTSVNNILVSLNTAGQLNGTVNLNGGTSAAPSGAGATAKSALQAKGWTVTTN